ncbi:MAG TPA: hypothetical protein VK821_13430 [Dehalococcoidia bacterium]|nr:hypothetical protein [Dehalococcoidia bacterium]
MPRRSRGHTYRKRSSPPLPGRADEGATGGPPVLEPSAETDDGSDVASPAAVPTEQAPSPYIRRRAPVAVAAPAASTARAARTLITDYGYVVGELKRIGLTFGGLIVLLILIARRLH